MHKWIKSTYPIHGTAVALGAAWLLATSASARLDACDDGEAGAADGQSAEVSAVAEAGRMNCPMMARADKAAKACDGKMECRRFMAQACDAKEGDGAGEAGAADGRDDVNDDTQ